MAAQVRELWAKGVTNESDFSKEQAVLKTFWTLLAAAEDLLNDGDWVRATLDGMSFSSCALAINLRGLKIAARIGSFRYAPRTGNGSVVCGFHHWRYDRDGLALGTSHSAEVQGKTPRK